MSAPLSFPSPNRRVVNRPNLGLYLDRPVRSLPDRALSDCLNVRVKEGAIRAQNMGWEKFYANALNGQVLLIDGFLDRGGTLSLVFGTEFDLYKWNESTSKPEFLTPREETGTITTSVSSAVVTGAGTAFSTNGIVAGDWLFIGATGKVDPEATWTKILTVDSDTQVTLVSNAPTAGAGQSFTIRKVFTGPVTDPWSTATFADSLPGNVDLWFATNGSDIVKWDGSATQVTVLSLGFSCRKLLVHKNKLLYLDLTVAGQRKPQSVRSSDEGTPENVTSGISTELAVLEGTDPIQDAKSLGDLVVVYGKSSVATMIFLGSPLVWLIRTAVPDFGVIGGKAVIPFGDFHFFIGNDRAYQFNGDTVQPFADHVFREVIRQIDPSRVARIITHVDEQNGEAHFVVPLTTDTTPLGTEGPERAYTVHYLEDTGQGQPPAVTMRDLPATATGFFRRGNTALRFSDISDQFDNFDFRWNDRFFAASAPFNLFGDDAGFVYNLGTVGDQDGAAINSFARSKRFRGDNGRMKAIVKRVEPHTDQRSGATYSLTVKVHGSDFANGDTTTLATESFDITHAGSRFVSPRVAARYYEVEFGTNGVKQPWELSGFAVETVQAGER